MAEETVDVLIVGAGASGAAVAWSLADTRMNILCLEQGGWMDPAQYPGMRGDWETRQLGDFSFSPNARGRREDYPVNDSDSPIAASMFNAVGGSTILYAAHFPRFHPSDFRVRTLDGVADDWPLDYARLEPYYDINARMMGVSGLAGDPGLSAQGACRCRRWRSASWARRWRRGFNRARLALVAVGQRHHDARARRARAVHQRRHLPVRLRAGRQGQHRHHLLAAGAAPGRDAQDALPRARDHRRRRTAWPTASSTTTPTASSGGRARTSWSSPATASARRACCSTRARSSFPTGWRIAAAWSART